MSRFSLRVRLVVWYLGVLAPALLALAIGSEVLVRRSLIDAADAALTARIEGVRLFVENAERERLSPDALRDEFFEWSHLTSGEVLIEVTGHGGEVFCTVTRPGWPELSSLVRDRTEVDAAQTLAGLPVRVKVGAIAARDNSYRVLVATPMEQTDAALDRFHTALLFLLPSILIAAAAGGYWITGRALAPVGRMTREVQAITVRNLDRRIDVPHTDDDLRRLAQTFNAMLARLHASVADLSQLTADASHELRTPVTLVRTTAEVALARDRAPAEYREALSDVLAHAERMSHLVNDLLALAHADAAAEPRADDVADVVVAAQAALEDMRRTLERARVTATIEGGAPLLAAMSAESLRRLFVILLSNAARYTPAGGRIVIAVARDPGEDTVVIDVVDSGIGIDAAERDRVFDRFYRGGAARAMSADGSGLGLSIARAIVVQHHGTIEIAGPPPGGGSDVRLRLPIG